MGIEGVTRLYEMRGLSVWSRQGRNEGRVGKMGEE